jgi:hypothetical protein
MPENFTVIEANFVDLMMVFWWCHHVDETSCTCRLYVGCAALCWHGKQGAAVRRRAGHPPGAIMGSALTTNAVQPPGHAVVIEARSRCIERPVGLPGLAVTASPRPQVNDGRLAREFAEIVASVCQ